MLTTYQEIRDRIYERARQLGLRVDWPESTSTIRYLILYDQGQAVVARATVPLRDLTGAWRARLHRDLDHVFGKDWME